MISRLALLYHTDSTNKPVGQIVARDLGKASKKQNIESVIMIIPRRTPPSFLRTVIALGYFFLRRFLIN